MFGKDGAIFSRRDFLKNISLIAGSSGVVLLSMHSACGQSSAGSTTAQTSTEEPPATSVPFTAIPEEIKFSPEYIWAKDEGGGLARLGITKKLFNLLTNKGKVDFNALVLPEVGRQVVKGEAVGVIESDKMSLDIITPISGEIVQNSEKILSNNNVYSTAWLLQVKMNHPEELDAMLTYTEYLEFIGQDYEF